MVAMAPWWQRSYRVPKNSSQLAAIDCLSGVQAEQSEEKFGYVPAGPIVEALGPQTEEFLGLLGPPPAAFSGAEEHRG
ncbi:hypothetical protein M3C74_09845 [Micrococcus lylae]|uniref:hypothetical protein n=1 Tax=Micrococcus TaxID=1269 RepID=UPI00114D064D|nr:MULTISPECIES: hypothetical protein [Micrococcus]MCT2008214.1 hypothetical protein [Micrococcus lylae]MCT2072121.1 hypothetical protein [Micrococcus lylae]